jgi:rRNA-processing protein FCF1
VEINRVGDSKRVKAFVILDTNFLIMLVRGLVAPSMISDVIDLSYTLISPEAVKKELEALAMRASSESIRRYAARALEMAKKLGVKFVNNSYSSMNADDAIQLLALNLKSSGSYVFVATSDRELRRRLRALGIPSIYYRESEARLEVEADII